MSPWGPPRVTSAKTPSSTFSSPAMQTLTWPCPEIRGWVDFREKLERSTCPAPAAGVDRVQHPEPVSPRKKSQAMTCKVFLQVVQELDEWLESKTPEVLKNNTPDSVGSVLPASIAQQGITFMDTYHMFLGDQSHPREEM